MNKKIFSMFLICSLLTVTNFDASEVNYAPVHPTSEEVEAAAATDLVEFNDDNLEQALADKLGVEKGEITVGDMETLTRVILTGEGISDLTGLEYATNLEELYLDENQIESDDLEPLSGLTNLTELGLDFNQIDNVEPLSGLTNLTSLTLGDNLIDNVEALSGLTNLTTLSLAYNQLEADDLEVLSGLTNLTFLNLKTNQIDNIEALSGLTNLTSLHLDSNLIDNIEPLSGLTNLTSLTLENNLIDNVEPLSGLTNLTYLDLYGNRITDMSPLSSLTDMEALYLGDQVVLGLGAKGELLPITVYSEDEITVDVTDIDGSTHTLSTGTLTPGRNFYYDTYNGVDLDPWLSSETISYSSYNPFIQPEIIYNTLLGDDAASTNEETVLSDEDLITLFGVYNSVDETVTVDQSGVDYSTPGDYDVIFTDESDNEFIGALTVTDVLPTIDVNEAEVTIEIGSSLDDILASIVYSATEITEGDLTDSVVIDDSAVDYNTAGTYELVLTVTDEEGNVVTKTISVIVEDDEVITDSQTGSEVGSETVSESSQMSLATTGSISSLALAIGLISIMGLTSIKRATNK